MLGIRPEINPQKTVGMDFVSKIDPPHCVEIEFAEGSDISDTSDCKNSNAPNDILKIELFYAFKIAKFFRHRERKDDPSWFCI